MFIFLSCFWAVPKCWLHLWSPQSAQEREEGNGLKKVECCQTQQFTWIQMTKQSLHHDGDHAHLCDPTILTTKIVTMINTITVITLGTSKHLITSTVMTRITTTSMTSSAILPAQLEIQKGSSHHAQWCWLLGLQACLATTPKLLHLLWLFSHLQVLLLLFICEKPPHCWPRCNHPLPI